MSIIEEDCFLSQFIGIYLQGCTLSTHSQDWTLSIYSQGCTLGTHSQYCIFFDNMIYQYKMVILFHEYCD
jgi:hypothetical protein